MDIDSSTRISSSVLLLCAALAVAGCAPTDETPAATRPADIPGLLAFWDFQEPAGQPRMSVGEHRYALQEMNGPIARVDDGVFGPYSADVEWGQWLLAPRRDVPGLDLHGGDQVTTVAWVKRESDRGWQYIAGMWDEGSEEPTDKPAGTRATGPARQYAIYMSGRWQTDHTTYVRTPAEHPAMGFVSGVGGATPGHPAAFDYATGGTVLQKDRWYMLAYTYDGEVIRVYVDGRLDENGNHNPFHYDGGIFDPGENGGDFTVAQHAEPEWHDYPEGVRGGQGGFDGRIGGLAVYGRALTPGEIDALYRATRAAR